MEKEEIIELVDEIVEERLKLSNSKIVKLFLNTNWKTTIGGAVSIGTVLVLIYNSVISGQPVDIVKVTEMLGISAAGIGLLFSKDSDK